MSQREQEEDKSQAEPQDQQASVSQEQQQPTNEPNLEELSKQIRNAFQILEQRVKSRICEQRKHLIHALQAQKLQPKVIQDEHKERIADLMYLVEQELGNSQKKVNRSSLVTIVPIICHAAHNAVIESVGSRVKKLKDSVLDASITQGEVLMQLAFKLSTNLMQYVSRLEKVIKEQSAAIEEFMSSGLLDELKAQCERNDKQAKRIASLEGELRHLRQQQQQQPPLLQEQWSTTTSRSPIQPRAPAKEITGSTTHSPSLMMSPHSFGHALPFKTFSRSASPAIRESPHQFITTPTIANQPHPLKDMFKHCLDNPQIAKVEFANMPPEQQVSMLKTNLIPVELLARVVVELLAHPPKKSLVENHFAWMAVILKERPEVIPLVRDVTRRYVNVWRNELYSEEMRTHLRVVSLALTY